MEIVVVGGGATGLKAAARIRRLDDEAVITVIESGKYPSVSKCGLPYYVGGMLQEPKNLLETTYGAVRDVNYFKKVKNIDVLVETKAVDIRRSERSVKIITKGGKEDELNYDYLILATGSKPVKPRIDGIDEDIEGIVHLHNIEDAEKIFDIWEEDAEDAVIIGAGLIGVECAEALHNLDMNVTIVEIMEHVLPSLLDEDIACMVESHLRGKGITVMTSSKVDKILNDGEKVTGVIINGKELKADIVVVAAGVKPNVELAKRAGIEIGKTGAIKVNEKMQTSDKRIYAGGDCVECKHILTGDAVYTPMGSVANKHGRIIANNICGIESTFPGVLGTVIFQVFGLSVGRTGLCEKDVRGAVVGRVAGADRFHFHPKHKPIRIKLIADSSGKLVGCQAAGMGVIDKRIDVAVSAITMGANVSELSNFDLAYAPPFSTAIDLILSSANMIKNKLDRLVDCISAVEFAKMLKSDDKFTVIDVRTEKEFKARKLPDERIRNIPLSELRERVNEVPDEVFLICQVGARSYEAARFLLQKGRKVRLVDGGYAFLQPVLEKYGIEFEG
ncbi:MAG: pyridine nucleotide-disulfide oxidoreductase [Archaeoglobus sp.]|nr:MAG: pyridine nucleotide-disulfide oxidoreductase [Archaeoglobus sp.]